jgi:hypothetical protein
MTKQELIERIAKAIAEMEGFYSTSTRPTLSQRNANPGNIRQWRDSRGRTYPTANGYVDFVAWASEHFPNASREEINRRAIKEGWRVLRVLIRQYVGGRYTQGKTPTVKEMFRVYAPSADGNNPDNYARFVARKLGVRLDQRLIDLVTT